MDYKRVFKNLNRIRESRPKDNTHASKFNKICKLTKFITADMTAVLKPYSNKNRHFHTLDHLISILELIEQFKKVFCENDIVYHSYQCAALFHDFVYNPRNDDNEEKSVEAFLERSSEFHEIDVELVCSLIRGTKVIDDRELPQHNQNFNWMDRSVIGGSVTNLIQYGEQIRKEYGHVPYTDFLAGHFKIIREILKTSKMSYAINNVDEYEKYMRARKLRVGVYVGSFNPFHVGHLDILLQSEKMFDKVIVAIGTNPDKKDISEWDKTIQTIEIPGVPSRFEQTQFNNMLLARYVHRLENIQNYDVTVIRGFRDANDINNELNQRKYSLEYNLNMKYVFLTTEPGIEHVSSSAIRKLQQFEEDVSAYLPTGDE